MVSLPPLIMSSLQVLLINSIPRIHSVFSIGRPLMASSLIQTSVSCVSELDFLGHHMIKHGITPLPSGEEMGEGADRLEPPL